MIKFSFWRRLECSVVLLKLQHIILYYIQFTLEGDALLVNALSDIKVNCKQLSSDVKNRISSKFEDRISYKNIFEQLNE